MREFRRVKKWFGQLKNQGYSEEKNGGTVKGFEVFLKKRVEKVGGGKRDWIWGRIGRKKREIEINQD